jgi:hypothetical protein
MHSTRTTNENVFNNPCVFCALLTTGYQCGASVRVRKANIMCILAGGSFCGMV